MFYQNFCKIKHKITPILIVVLSLFLYSCKNAKLESSSTQFFTGIDHLNSDQPKNPDSNTNPNDGSGNNSKPPKPKLPEIKEIILKARMIHVEELRNIELPYKTSFHKVLKFGQRVKIKKEGKKCAEKYRKKECIVNKQIVFKFNLDFYNQRQYPKYQINDIILLGDFYSIEKNYDTEMICILNNDFYRCSGKAIDSIPKVGLSFLAKLLYWNKDFWKKGARNILKSNFFSNQFLPEGKVITYPAGHDRDKLPKQEITYVRIQKPISLKRIFNFSTDGLEQLTTENDIYMVVADDTYVGKNLTLKIRLQLKKHKK